MSYKYDLVWLQRIGEAKKKFVLTGPGTHFASQFLFKRGEHLFVYGDTGSGKTQKGYWLADWISKTRETVIWLDTGKNQEILPLLGMGVPVRIICPKGTTIELDEYNPEKKDWGDLQKPPEIMPVPDAGTAWWAVKKGMINVFSFRNQFANTGSRDTWMSELFETLAVWTRAGRMPHIYPFALFGDEAHWFNAGVRISGDRTRRRLSEAVTERVLEIRGSGGRLIFFAQNYKNITPASRENLNCSLLCRNAHVNPSENPSLSRFNKWTPRYKPSQGLFVFSDGSINPVPGPWNFPYYPMPKVRMRYVGEFDKPTKEAVAQKEIADEMTPDLSKYSGILQDLQDYTVPGTISRYEMPEPQQD